MALAFQPPIARDGVKDLSFPADRRSDRESIRATGASVGAVDDPPAALSERGYSRATRRHAAGFRVGRFAPAGNDKDEFHFRHKM
jgi:hypothetical protein